MAKQQAQAPRRRRSNEKPSDNRTGRGKDLVLQKWSLPPSTTQRTIAAQLDELRSFDAALISGQREASRKTLTWACQVGLYLRQDDAARREFYADSHWEDFKLGRPKPDDHGDVLGFVMRWTCGPGKNGSSRASTFYGAALQLLHEEVPLSDFPHELKKRGIKKLSDETTARRALEAGKSKRAKKSEETKGKKKDEKPSTTRSKGSGGQSAKKPEDQPPTFVKLQVTPEHMTMLTTSGTFPAKLRVLLNVTRIEGGSLIAEVLRVLPPKH